MKKLAIALLLTVAAAPAFAEPACTPGDAVKPVWEAIRSFEDSGGNVVSFKINDGLCYEIYGSVDGTNMEVFFDPNTGAELDRIKA